MLARSKYWGQQLTAKQILQRYAAGERDFRGAILNGCNFSGANLSGADFSGAQIRGTRFVDATLIGTKFCHAETGPANYWELVRLLAILIAIPCGFLQAVASFYIGFGLSSLDRGIRINDFPILTAAVAAVIVTTGLIIGARVISGAGAVMTATIVNILTGFFAALLAGFISAFGYDNFLVVFLTVLATASAIAIANIGLSESVARRIRQDGPGFEVLRNLSVLGGTTFSGATLTEASFASAILNKANFANSRQRSTILTRVRWQNAQQLEQAHLGNTYLRDQRIRHLLTRLNGAGLNGQASLDLSNTDLRSVNLAGAQLQRVNLRRANLNGATFAGAELQGANLTGAHCLGTNFTAAQFTGACIKAWKINNATVLENIDCQYIFLGERLSDRGYGDRRPCNQDNIFQPGDFEQFFQQCS